MQRSLSRKRPWLAAVLATLATGLGHLYLRRWRRALGWLAVAFGVSYVFVDPASLDALASGATVDPLTVLPVVIVAAASIVDAYLLAHAQNAVARTATAPDGRPEACPNCGNDLDPDLEFCHWCSADVPAVETARRGEADRSRR